MPIKLPFRPRRDTYPPDLWTQCPSCNAMQFNKQLDRSLRVCPNCGHHFRLSAQARLAHLVDPDTFVERDVGLQSVDPLGFVDQRPYPDRVASAQVATGLRDALIWGEARVGGTRVAICVMDFGFMGGSMGAVVGEKITRAAETALLERIPLIVVCASGGARMQEGTLALMQLAKTVGSDRAVAGRPRAVRLDPERPHHGRRLRLVRVARRRQPGRAERPDRIRRGEGRGRHDRAGAAAGLPARRVPVRARLRRPGRPARRAPRRAHRPAAVPPRARCLGRCPRHGPGRRVQAALVPRVARRQDDPGGRGAGQPEREPREPRSRTGRGQNRRKVAGGTRSGGNGNGNGNEPGVDRG